MENKPAARDWRSRRNERDRNTDQYNTGDYFRHNRELGNARGSMEQWHDDEELYDENFSGKRENYNAAGYYGSNYGGIAELNRGRNFESNAGYRDNYDHLTTGQWPEIEKAAESRNFDLRQYELEQRGVHRGKGPRNWQRADQRILEDINDMLTEDAYIDASDIEVSVEKGNIVLTGVVENRGVKRRAEDLVERVSGVKNLENRLRVRFQDGRSVNIHNSDQGEEQQR